MMNGILSISSVGERLMINFLSLRSIELKIRARYEEENCDVEVVYRILKTSGVDQKLKNLFYSIGWVLL
jgi:hypothetical protein